MPSLFSLKTFTMYRPNDIKANLTDLWGWRQNYDTADFTISDSLTQTITGQYYQEVHPLLTLENVKSIAPDFKNIDYDGWLVTTQYRVGDRVTLNELHYRAKVDNIGLTPETNPTQWERFDPFSEWLDNKTQASVLKAIRSFWDSKMADNKMRNILESKTLFNGTARIKNLVPEGPNFVGFELVPIRANGVTTKIEKIGLQFTGTQDVTLYLYHSSRIQPIKTETFTRTRDGGMQWFDVTDFLLPYSSSEVDSGGSWYLVYDQTAVSTGRAISKDKDWSKKPCGTCDRDEVSSHRIWSKYLEVHPFKIASDQVVGGAIWDVANNLYTYETNYGLNLQLTIECDITDIIIQQKKTFQNIIGLQVAIDMLREFAYNPSYKIGRKQQNPGMDKMSILYELDGDSQSYKKSGLGYQFSEVMKAVSIDIKNMSRVCTPCKNGGVRFKTV